MTHRRGPNWDNYIMRKFGQSIREKIAESFEGYANAVIWVRRERLLDNLLKHSRDWNKETVQ